MAETPKRVTPADYARTFEGSESGKAVLEDLVRRFGGKLWVPGGPEGARQTDRNCGRRSVLDFIVGMVNRAAGVEDPNADQEE